MALLSGKIAVVTASTRGIGLAIAQTLALEEAFVYLAVRNLSLGQEKAEEIKAKGGKADVVYFDADAPASYADMIAKIVEKSGRLDILVNNYGTTDVKTDFDLVHTSVDAFLGICNDNLRSVFVPCQEAVKVMQMQQCGSIINISSIGGAIPDLSRIAYGTSKAAINFLTKNIAVQYARDHIRCNAVMPGYIETDATANHMSEAFLNTFLQNVPLNRVGKPLDIANAVLFLASDMSSFITGETLSVAGGFGIPSPMYGFYGMMKSKG